MAIQSKRSRCWYTTCMTKPAFICIDLETTGLDYDKCCIIEAGLVVADENLEVIAADSWLVRPTTDMSEMDDFVRDMHTKNGLLADLENCEDEWGNPVPPPSVNAVQQQILDWLDGLELEAGVFPMFGSSIGFDRRMLSIHMPNLEAWFHYRNIDMSTIKEVAKIWRPDLKWKPNGSKAHRVLDDCLATLDEARYYKVNIFNPQ
jgi:oligoribonuclease